MIISMPLQAWRRRKNYDPMAAAGKKKEVMIDSLNGKTMVLGDDENYNDDAKVSRKQSSSSLRSAGGKSPREAETGRG